MGTNTLTDYSATTAVTADRIDQYRNAELGDKVPRNNTTGAPEAEAGDLGTTTYPWNIVNCKELVVDGSPFDPNNLLTDKNQITSGAVRSGSSQPLFLQASGSTNSVSILGATNYL